MPIAPIFLSAEQLGVRLEVVSGLPIWEAHPAWNHQKTIDRIRATIAPIVGSRCKDLEIGPPFYLAQGVKDVIVFDPTSLLVLHARREKTVRLTSPQKLRLECGCELSV